jgi:hypothetical protein
MAQALQPSQEEELHMSVMNTHAHVLLKQAAAESRRDARQHHRPAARERPTVRELLQRVVPGIFFIPLAGPPVILLLGPWLVLVLLIIPPAAFLITLVLVLAVAAGLLFALGAIIASPYLLLRHLLARHQVRASQPVRRRRFAFAHRHWLPGSAAGASSPQASLGSSPDGPHIAAGA